MVLSRSSYGVWDESSKMCRNFPGQRGDEMKAGRVQWHSGEDWRGWRGRKWLSYRELPMFNRMNEWININVFTRKHSSICRWYEYYDIYMLKLPQRRILLLLLDLELSWYEIWPLIWNASEACYTHKIIPLYTKPLNNLDVGMLNLITQLSGDS